VRLFLKLKNRPNAQGTFERPAIQVAGDRLQVKSPLCKIDRNTGLIIKFPGYYSTRIPKSIYQMWKKNEIRSATDATGRLFLNNVFHYCIICNKCNCFLRDPFVYLLKLFERQVFGKFQSDSERGHAGPGFFIEPDGYGRNSQRIFFIIRRQDNIEQQDIRAHGCQGKMSAFMHYFIKRHIGSLAGKADQLCGKMRGYFRPFHPLRQKNFHLQITCLPFFFPSFKLQKYSPEFCSLFAGRQPGY